MHQPIQRATWSPTRDRWETLETDIFGHSVAYSETLPKSGMTQGGRLYELPMSVPPTIVPASSSSPHLPTPQAADGMGGHLTRSGSRSSELLLPGVAKAYGEGRLNPGAPCLPTPTASDGEKERNNPAQARRKSPPLSAISAHFPETDEPTIF